MIRNIIDLLQIDEFYGKNDKINFAKGINQFPQTMDEAKELIKRVWHG